MKTKTLGAAVGTVVKDAILILITFGLISAIFGMDTYGSFMNKIAMVMMFGGIPFGWRWASKIVTAISFQGIFLKLVISFFLGWLAVWVVVIGDIISCVTAFVNSRK